ncbi:MAG: glycoside hydrolase [Rhizobiaceae bacterium]
MTGIAAPAAIALIASALLLAVIERALPPGFLAAKSNPRSNHDAPARQIGGLAVIPATLAALLWGGGGSIAATTALWLAAGTLILFVAGAVDDAGDLSAAAKTVPQVAAATLTAYGMAPHDLPPLALLPAFAGSVLLVVALVWAVNLVNFMDGLDWMVVAGIGVPAAIIGLSGLANLVDQTPAVVLAAILAAALVPFAVANRPPARIFLGDSGSLAIGLVAGVIVLGLAAHHSIFVGLLPFAYFIVDSGATLVQRTLKRKNIFAAHSEHAYQIAKRAGRPTLEVSLRVAGVSGLTAVLAVLALTGALPPIAAFGLGYVAAILLFLVMRRGR